MTSQTENVMEIDRFWAIVAKAEWEKHKDFRISQRRLRQELPTLEDLDAFGNCFSKLRATLAARIEKAERHGDDRLGLGDDSFSDLIAHIVGLGRDEYQACIENPKRAIVRGNHHDFTESFSYAVPHKEHYGKDPVDNEQRRRDRVAKDLEAAVSAAITPLLEEAKRLCVDLRQSPVKYHVQAGCDDALRTAFPYRSGDDQ